MTYYHCSFQSEDGRFTCDVTFDLVMDLATKVYKTQRDKIYKSAGYAYDGTKDYHLFKFNTKHALSEAKQILKVLKKAFTVLLKARHDKTAAELKNLIEFVENCVKTRQGFTGRKAIGISFITQKGNKRIAHIVV